MDTLDFINRKNLRTDLPKFCPGDTIRVYYRIREVEMEKGKGLKAEKVEKERIQPFEGVVIRVKKGGIQSTFTVRKESFGVGVERTFPLHSPMIKTIELISKGQVRRAKLHYLRQLRGKAARIKEKQE